ncbi:hypothetical protein INT47_009088, partial [Mucor saturninus]
SRNTNKPEVKYGLLGLLDTIREIDPDRRTMSIGYDVDRLGLGLDRSYKPKDNIQELVAKKLYERHWRFNKSLCLWMTKEIDEHGRPKKPLQYLPEESTFDQGTFTVFDPFKWKKIKKELSIVRNTIEIKF